MTLEYRVVWQRKGRIQQVRRYATEKGARMRYAFLTSDEPWKLLGYEANDYVCCTGAACVCSGETFQQKTARVESAAPLKFARVEARTIGEWKETLWPKQKH